MKLAPPLSQWITGETPTHCSIKKLPTLVTTIPESAVVSALQAADMVSSEGKPTSRALEKGLLDTCEGKALWNVALVNRFLKPETTSSTSSSKPARKPRTEPAWVDLLTIGTYFGVNQRRVGAWLDQLKLRETPKLDVNESGAVDMLAVARQEQQKQANGFIGRNPTARALEQGFARELVVTNRKQEEVTITQWNLDLVKALLVSAGHPLDTERKMALKGTGKNSNVKVSGFESRSEELYRKWAALYRDEKTRWQIPKLFRGQPTAILELVESKMGMPGYLTSGRYLSDK